MTKSRVAVGRMNKVERWMPGVRVVRHYERRWLRADLVAGLVLAAILVPQGMAYAELAGLPAVTGLYTTIACLVGYAMFGPSRVLVLGPDSSISPLIFAAIVPLARRWRSGDGDRARRDARVARRARRDRARPRQARLRRRPALERGAGRVHERARHHDHRGPAARSSSASRPTPTGSSTRSSSSSATSTRRDATTLVVGVAVLVVLLVLPRVLPRVPAILVAVVGGHDRLGRARSRRRRGRDRRLAPPWRPDAHPCPGRASTTSGRC